MELLHAGAEGDAKALDDLVDEGGLEDSVPADVLPPHLHQDDVERPACHAVQPRPAECLELILSVEVEVVVVVILVEDVLSLEAGQHLLPSSGEVRGGLG